MSERVMTEECDMASLEKKIKAMAEKAVATAMRVHMRVHMSEPVKQNYECVWRYHIKRDCVLTYSLRTDCNMGYSVTGEVNRYIYCPCCGRIIKRLYID